VFSLVKYVLSCIPLLSVKGLPLWPDGTPLVLVSWYGGGVSWCGVGLGCGGGRRKVDPPRLGPQRREPRSPLSSSLHSRAIHGQADGHEQDGPLGQSG